MNDLVGLLVPATPHRHEEGVYLLTFSEISKNNPSADQVNEHRGEERQLGGVRACSQ